ncbi:MAG: SMR family transporter [Myxococcota bacterium]
MTRTDLLNLLAALAYALGGACMKASGGLARPAWLVGVYAAFVLGSTLQTVAMRDQDLGSNYLVVLGLEATGAFAIGLLVFREPITVAKVVGLVLVGIGIALLRK